MWAEKERGDRKTVSHGEYHLPYVKVRRREVVRLGRKVRAHQLHLCVPFLE